MSGLFLRMFLWFSVASTVLVLGLIGGYLLSNPDQLPFAWPRVGRGAIVSSGRTAIQAYERGGEAELTNYLASVENDTGIRGALFDPAGRELSGRPLEARPPRELPAAPESLVIRLRGHTAAVRLRGRGSAQYAFVAALPRRETSGYWTRVFFVSFFVTGALLCFALARHVTAPIVHLRAVTARFSGGDLGTRVTAPAVLGRNDEIGGLARDFNQMASRIETLMRSQRRLIGDVSHELRSPITRLSLALELIKRRGEAESRASLARIEREVERLNALIAQLLMLSRLECLDQPPPMETIDLCGLLREVESDAEFEAASLDRSVRLTGCAPCAIHGARDLVRSAIENVVRNALKYTGPNGHVAVRLERPDAGSTAEIVVEDEGPGVPPEALDHIFEPFYRVDEARDRSSGGAGLGLAIARQIVTLHGGTIRASNRETRGLRMRISLPAADKS